MRILWYSPPPNVPSAYGLQTALFAPRLAALGHQVVICQMMGSPMGALPAFDGVPIIGSVTVDQPGRQPDYLLPRPAVIREAFGGKNPDLIIVLKDAWVLPRDQFRPWNTAVWTNIDTEPMGKPDRDFFAGSAARPVMVAEYGMRAARKAGLSPVYVPHGIETAQWHPFPGGKAKAKERVGLNPGVFAAGINGMNVGAPPRKNFDVQFQAFGRFHAKHPNSVLLVNAVRAHPEGMDLGALAEACGLVPGKSVLFPAHAQDHDGMLSWYQALDVLLSCSWGEGFCVPIVEAHACGVPVIATACSAMAEKITPGTGWLTGGQKFWHPSHQAWWVTADVQAITTRLELALTTRPNPAALKAAADRYDADHVTTQYWKPALDQLAGG